MLMIVKYSLSQPHHQTKMVQYLSHQECALVCRNVHYYIGYVGALVSDVAYCGKSWTRIGFSSVLGTPLYEH